MASTSGRLAARAGPTHVLPRRDRRGARRHRRRRGVGADPPHRADHERGALPPVGLGRCRRSRTSTPARSCSSRRPPAALVVSLLAKWAPVIRGHGIPEAMEAILTRQSRIAPRAAVAKPLSAAVAIGTGGPFGAEGPIIVTGGAFGSLIGQVIRVTPSERKILPRVRRGGGHVGDVRRAARRGGARDRAAALRVLEPRVRAARRRVERRRAMHAALFGAGPLFHVPPHDYAGLVDASRCSR